MVSKAEVRTSGPTYLSSGFSRRSKWLDFSSHRVTKGITNMAVRPVVIRRRSMRISATALLPPLVGAQYTRLPPPSTPGCIRHCACRWKGRGSAFGEMKQKAGVVLIGGASPFGG